MHTLTNLTDKDIQIILAALAVVTPSGGGSDPFMVLRKVGAQVPVAQNHELETEFVRTMLEEALEADVITGFTLV